MDSEHPAKKIILVDTSSFITLAEAGAENFLYERSESVKVPEHVVSEVTDEPARGELHRAIHSYDLTVSQTDHIARRHFPYYRAAAFHLDETTPFVGGELHWSGDAALVGTALHTSDIKIVTDDGYLRRRCRDLTIPVTGSLGIVLGAVDEKQISTTEALEILQQIQHSSAWLGDDLIERVEREIKESKRDEGAGSQNTSR